MSEDLKQSTMTPTVSQPHRTSFDRIASTTITPGPAKFDPATQTSSIPDCDLRSTPRMAWRLFLTCWIVYIVHFSTNIVREIYPALAIGDHLSFRVDEYAHMHPDLFEKEGYGWHIGNNPGASMVAAIPYAMARPVIDPIVDMVRRHREASGEVDPPAFNSPWPMQRDFYIKAWRRGHDVKFGLAAFVIQAMCMAPTSALGVLAMFYALRCVLRSERTALYCSLLYAFGTPLFFRTGFLNHNMMIGHITFMGFLAMWNPSASPRCTVSHRYLIGGISGGTALLFDYSGAVILLALFVYGIATRFTKASWQDAARHASWYAAGTMPPVLLLWFYQWKSFGHPLMPGQHWMPPVEWSEHGYQGYGFPQLDLFLQLGFDYRFGLFVTCPMLLLALGCPWTIARGRTALPWREFLAIMAMLITFWLFFAGSSYTRLQFNTGLRYMAPMIPFLFLPAAIVLQYLPRSLVVVITVLSLIQSWALAMYREVELGPGILDPIVKLFTQGITLPALTTLDRMDAYRDLVPRGLAIIVIYLAITIALYLIWRPYLVHPAKVGGHTPRRYSS